MKGKIKLIKRKQERKDMPKLWKNLRHINFMLKKLNWQTKNIQSNWMKIGKMWHNF